MNEKIRRLYGIREKVDDEVEENFGYCPSGKHFDDLIEEMRSLEFEVKAISPDEWKKYSAKYY